MRRWLSLLLLLGALLGLMGQEAAFAHTMPAGSVAQKPSVAQKGMGDMSTDCAEMMGLAKQNSQPEKPCQGMTPDCVAKMGCAIAVALIPAFSSSAPTAHRASSPRQMSVAPLMGRDIRPETHPPAILG